MIIAQMPPPPLRLPEFPNEGFVPPPFPFISNEIVTIKM